MHTWSRQLTIQSAEGGLPNALVRSFNPKFIVPILDGNSEHVASAWREKSDL